LFTKSQRNATKFAKEMVVWVAEPRFLLRCGGFHLCQLCVPTVHTLSIDDQGVSCSCLGTVAHLLMSGASRWFAGPQEAMQVGHGEVGPAPNEDRNRDEYVEVALTDTHETYHAAPPFTIGWMPHVMPSNRRAKTFLHHGATPPALTSR